MEEKRWNPQDPASALQWKESQLPARELGLQLHSMEVMTASNYQLLFKDGIKARIDGLAVSQDALSATHQKQIVDLAASIDCRQFTRGWISPLAAA